MKDHLESSTEVAIRALGQRIRELECVLDVNEEKLENANVWRQTLDALLSEAARAGGGFRRQGYSPVTESDVEWALRDLIVKLDNANHEIKVLKARQRAQRVERKTKNVVNIQLGAKPKTRKPRGK